MTDRVVKVERLSEIVAGTIGRWIVSGKYMPGDTLPTELKIQEDFGISRTAAREAMMMLSAKGLTASRPNIGTRVRPAVDWNMFDLEVLRWQIDQNPTDEFIHALFEMRGIIEPAAAARAAGRATDDEIVSLGMAMDGIQYGAAGSSIQINANIQFHLVILEASGNPMLRSVGAMIKSALLLAFQLSWDTALAQDAIEQHRAVYEAVAHRNAEQAFFAMRRLLRNSTGNVADALWAARHDGEDYH